MRSLSRCLLAITLLAVCGTARPVIDKTAIASYIRYAEAFTDSVTISLEDPAPSSFPGFWRLIAHVTAGTENLGDKIYYINNDGTELVSGAMWRVPGSPFDETLSTLPPGLPAFGPPGALLQIVVFSDFQCPYCKQFAHTIREDLTKSFPGQVRVSFADYPLASKHPWASAGAEAAHCIGDGNVDAFWKFHDWIFEHQTEVAEDGKNLKEKVLAFAQEQGLDGAAIGVCMDSHVKNAEVVASEKIAQLLGVRQTPTFFINGRKIEGALPWTNLKALVEYEQRRPKIAIDRGAPTGGTSPQ